MSVLDPGWGFPGASRKCHYFAAGESRSLCGKWMFTGHRQPDAGISSPDDCVVCRRKLDQ